MPGIFRYLYIFFYVSIIIPHIIYSQNQVDKSNSGDFKYDTIINSNGDTIIEQIVYEYDTIAVPGDTIKHQDTLVITVYDTTKTEYSVGLYYAPSYFYNRYSASIPENLKLMEDTYSPEWNYSFGGYFGVKRKNWTLQTGISYSRYKERFNYTTYDISIDSIDVLIYDTLDSYYVVNGNDTDWVYITDTNYEKQADSVNTPVTNKYLNKYLYFEIPLIIGYEINKEKKLSYTVKAGTIFGIFYKAEGKTFLFDDNNKVYELKDNSPFVKMNISLFFGLGFNYHISDKISLMVEPSFMQNIKSVFKKDYPVSLKRSVAGIRFGVQYSF